MNQNAPPSSSSVGAVYFPRRVVHDARLAVLLVTRRPFVSIAPLAAALAGCPQPSRPPPPHDVPAAQRDVTSPRDVPSPRRPRGRVDLSPPAVADASSPTRAPSLAWTSEGLVAAWVEGEVLRVQRRGRDGWAPLGERLNSSAALGPVRVSRAPDGAPAVVWSEAATGMPAEMRFARWDGRRWVQQPGPLNPQAPRTTVTEFVVAWVGETPVVSMVFARQGANTSALRSVRWTGRGWDLAGPPSLVPASSRVQALATASCEGGHALLAWIEVAASGTPVLELRRWNAPRRHWTAFPRANAPLVDAGTRSLGLACGAAGEPVLAYAWSGGMHPVQRWDAAAEEWSPLGLPRDDLRGATLASGPWLGARGDALWVTWRTSAGRLSAAMRRGGAWRVLSDALDPPEGAGGDAALGDDDALYVSALAPSNPRMVAGFWPD